MLKCDLELEIFLFVFTTTSHVHALQKYKDLCRHMSLFSKYTHVPTSSSFFLDLTENTRGSDTRRSPEVRFVRSVIQFHDYCGRY